jgi:hypothetical protein
LTITKSKSSSARIEMPSSGKRTPPEGDRDDSDPQLATIGGRRVGRDDLRPAQRHDVLGHVVLASLWRSLRLTAGGPAVTMLRRLRRDGGLRRLSGERRP